MSSYLVKTKQTAASIPNAGTGKIHEFVDSADGLSKSKDEAGTVVVYSGGAASAGLAAHIAAADPHPQYETSAEAQAKVDAHANLTNNPHATTKAQVGLGSVDNTADTAKPVSTAQQTALNLKYDASNPSNYVNAAGASSASPVQSVAGKTGTVTLVKADVGLSNVDNTTDAAKPVSTATQTALNLKYDSSNPSSYQTAAQVSASIAAVVASAPAALDTLNELATALGNDANFATTTATSLGNRLRVDTAAQGLSGTQKTNAKTNIDLQNVDNTSDANKPVSSATTTALNLKYDASNPTGYQTAAQVTTAVNAHATLTNNPHAVTKTQVGLGNVDDTSDTNKPVSTATTTALNLKYDASNPNSYQTLTQLNTGLATKANTSHTHPLSDLTQSAATTNQVPRWNGTAWVPATIASGVTDHTLLTNIGTNTHAQIDTHIASTANPHGVTKAQVGLGSVDNTSDLSKPISTLTQTALNAKYDSSNPSGYETPALLNTRDTNNRSRANHTGSQLAATISDFAATVRSTVLTGISFVNSAVVAADSVLAAIGKLQGQIDVRQELVVGTALNNNSNTTLTNISDLIMSVTSGKSYMVEGFLMYRSAATNTGIGFTVALGGGAAGTIAMTSSTIIGNDGTGASYAGAHTTGGDLVISPSVPAANTDYIFSFRGIFNCTTSGVLTPQFRSEINGSQVTVQAGSNVTAREF